MGLNTFHVLNVKYVHEVLKHHKSKTLATYSGETWRNFYIC